jgi:membrane protein implicated in regulation of membrane protease activity
MDSSSGAQRDGTTRMPAPQIVLVAALILIPILALMWVSSYAKREPELWGMPFFYWYQFCWVFVTAILTSIAYRIVVAHERRRGRPPSSRGLVEASDDGVDR